MQRLKRMHDERFRKEMAEEIFEHFKRGRSPIYDEEKHCKLLIDIMLDKERGTVAQFCVEAYICDRTFYKWVKQHELFRNLYYFSKMVAFSLWEEEGVQLKNKEFPMGTVNYEFEHWKMIGWTRFGISKNSRIKLELDAGETPAQHYAAILKQAADGDFTAAEFKQLMEAVNVGINVHQVFELQKQIDELKSDLNTMVANTNAQNPYANKGTA